MPSAKARYAAKQNTIHEIMQMTGFKSRTTFYKYVVKVVALSRQDGSIVWTAQLPAGANATLAVVGNTLLAGAGFPLTTTQHPVVVAYRLGA